MIYGALEYTPLSSVVDVAAILQMTGHQKRVAEL
jgi:hypothetical protein